MQAIEVLEELVLRVGSALAVADLLDVSPPAVSIWRAEGAMRPANEAQVRRLLLAYWTRRRYIYGWLMQQTIDMRRAEYELVIESVTGSAEKPDMTRSFMKREKSGRMDTAAELSVMFLGYEMIVDGDVIVFYADRRGEEVSAYVYVNRPDVTVWFERREWEPFWPLVPFIKGRLLVRK